jgi:DNA repair protein RadC
VLGLVEIRAEGITATLVDVRMVFASAFNGLAAPLVLAHKYPWGNLKARQADLNFSQKLTIIISVCKTITIGSCSLSPGKNTKAFVL